MLIGILGFGLLLALFWGLALSLLSLLLLGVAMGLQFLIVFAGLAPGGGPIIREGTEDVGNLLIQTATVMNDIVDLLEQAGK